MSPQRKPAETTGTELIAIGHYHQPPGRHPNPVPTLSGSQIIELVTYGRGWVLMEDGQWQEVLPGTLLWHVEGDDTIGRSDFDNPYHCLAVRFRTSGPDANKRPAPRLTQWSDLDAVRNFTNEVVSSYAMERVDGQTALRYIMARVHFQIQLYLSQTNRQSMPPQLQKVVRQIDLNYGEALTLKTLAALADWSVPQLHKTFREYLGQSPHQWLLTRRVQAARERLANTNQPIKSIAADCGFYSAAAFCAHFKRSTGTTPNAYRRQMTQS